MGWDLIIKNFNIMWVHYVIQFLGGRSSQKKLKKRKDCLKGGHEQVADLKGGLAEKKESYF